ncbi:MAG: flagellar biosynthesis protein FlhF [Nitrospira sp.]|nr:flagellar biosynthesis protein FlhF [Nitrospira sp.]MDH4302510.1 flagellar biosynthesis protein FlhF [Nitrospira sp.]MDH5192354.1 flagellar biosynthesis protein FlhF [Nitrospira sp.]
MKVKTFHALTMQDALRAIKEELGPDAIILSSKEVREGGRLLRAFNHPVLEVMAAVEHERPPVVREGARVQESAPAVQASGDSSSNIVSMRTFQQTLRGVLEPTGEASTGERPRQHTSKKSTLSKGKSNHLRKVRAVYGELSRLLQDLSPGTNEPRTGQSLPFLSTLRRALREQGMHPSSIELLLREALKAQRLADLPDEQSIRRALHQEIVRSVRAAGPLLHGPAGPAIGLLIGPSGAGKTSAVAKLAAYYRLEQRKSVALITFDTYRETAVEQLRRYAKIIGVPFACAMSARQVQAGLRRHAQVDLVLMDMPGIAPADLALANELRRLLKHDTITTHLVLPASTRVREACRMTACVRALSPVHLLFTKLDETESCGTMFEVARMTGIPLSYWSVGRRVPGDLEVSSPEALATRLMTFGPEGTHGPAHRSVEDRLTLAATGTYHR